MVIRETLMIVCMMIILTNVIAGPLDIDNFTVYNFTGTINMPNITMAPEASYSETLSVEEMTPYEYFLLYTVIAVYVGLLLFFIKMLLFSKEKK